MSDRDTAEWWSDWHAALRRIGVERLRLATERVTPATPDLIPVPTRWWEMESDEGLEAFIAEAMRAATQPLSAPLTAWQTRTQVIRRALHPRRSAGHTAPGLDAGAGGADG